MKRIINNLLCFAALLSAYSCQQQELTVDMPANESIILDLSSGLTKAYQSSTEQYVDHIDVFIFDVSSGRPDMLMVHETFTVNNMPQVVLDAKRTDFDENQEYFVYLVANSNLDFSALGISSFSDLNDLKQEDMYLHLTGLNVPDAPRYFLMDAIAEDSEGNSPVVLYNGKPEENTELNAVLARAAAKVVVNITASENIVFRNYSIEDGSEGGLFYVRNLPYDTWVLAETQDAEDLQNVLLRTTAKTDTEYFTWHPEAVSGDKNVSLTTYVYPHHWDNASILDKETCAIINLPMDYIVSETETIPYHNSWYKIPMTDNSTFERNNLYQINITLDRPGASQESEPIELEDISYTIEDWTGVEVSVGNESRPEFLQLNTDHVDMYNVNSDKNTLKFTSSSEIDNIVLVSASYVNKFGQTVQVNEEIWAEADPGLNGGITIFSAYVKEEGVVANDSHNNVIRYMEFVVYNETGQSQSFTVNQYPTLYITHEVGHYSYRDDFGGTTYLAAGDPNYSGATWNNNSKTWSYTENASSSNFFASKVANSYSLDSNGKGTLQNPSGSNGTNYNLSYVYWSASSSGGGFPGMGGYPGGSSGSGNNREPSRRTSSVGSGFNNPRMYHVHVTATSADYIVAKPRLDENGFTESTADNTMLVSPSFMIASQLGTTDMGGGSSTISIDKARQHCEQYVEVTYDSAGNRMAYDDWRLPTAAEIDIILAHQYDSQAMVEVLSGGNYYCAYNPAGSGNTQYLKKNEYNSLTSNHVRCIRDAY